MGFFIAVSVAVSVFAWLLGGLIFAGFVVLFELFVWFFPRRKPKTARRKPKIG